MSNAILTSNVRVPFLAEIEANLPLITNGTVQYNKNFVGGNGSTLGILVPSYGNDVGTGADVTGDISDIKSGERTVTLTQYHKAVSLTQVEQSLELSSYEDQVAKPNAQKMASDIQKVAVDTIKLGAATSYVSATGKYTDIGEGVANLESSRATGDVYGIMSPKIAKGVVDSGLSFFQANLQGSFSTGDLGSYLGASFFKSQDLATNLVIGAQTITTALVDMGTAYVAGATSLVLKSTALVGTFPKYQSFTVAGVNSVDIFGNDSGLPYQFVLQAGVTAGSNALTATIQGVYASGPLKNVTALPANNAAVTFPHTASTTYQPVIFWDKSAWVTATAQLRKLTMTEAKPTAGKLMNMLTSVGSDAVKGIDICRWDVLLGFLPIYRNLISIVWIKVA